MIMRPILYFPILFFLILNTVIAKDLIIDRDGNELEAVIISADLNGNVVYKTTTDSLAEQKVLPRSKIFMIKYEDGRKDVVKNTMRIPEITPISQGTIAVSLLGGTGIFGLFNVNNVFYQIELHDIAKPKYRRENCKARLDRG